MLRELRVQVSSARRFTAVGLLMLGLAVGVWGLVARQEHPLVFQGSRLVAWSLGAYLGIRLFAYILLDPLLSNRRTALPGFARDLVVFGLYVAAAAFLLHRVGGLNLGTLLGTGAIAAAVAGLSLQESLGNLFAGFSLNLDPAFRVGDWIEVSGTVRGGPGVETFVGQVESMTWRSVQLVTENGDRTILPNRTLAQAVVVNLDAPCGAHRRALRVCVAPHGHMAATLAALAQALGGIPHRRGQRPEVVTHSFDQGGVVLELRWWALGVRHGREAAFQAVRLAQTLLPRLGVPLIGPYGATALLPPPARLELEAVAGILRRMGLPDAWAGQLQDGLLLRRAVPGEGVILEGDPGESLFMVMSGNLQVVKAAEHRQPYPRVGWEVLADLGPGQWFGEGSLLTGAPRSATVVAAGDCELVEVPKAAFESCLKRDPQVLEQLVDLMEARAARRLEAPQENDGREQWLEQIRAWFRLEPAA